MVTLNLKQNKHQAFSNRKIKFIPYFHAKNVAFCPSYKGVALAKSTAHVVGALGCQKKTLKPFEPRNPELSFD